MRRVKVVPLARRNLDAYIKQLNESEPEAWPKFLFCAWAIVAEELKKPDIARETVIGAVAAAHTCADAISSRTQANARNQATLDVSSAISRIFKPIERRAPIRRALDEVARREFQEGHTDSEAIFSFFNGCAYVVSTFRGVPDAKRMMNALGGAVDLVEKIDDGSEPRILNLINNYEAMHTSERTSVEESLRQLIGDLSASLTALDVFSAIAHSLTVATIVATREYSGDLLRAYVAEVAEIWRKLGFCPTRRRKHDDPDYRSEFHRFLEFVLIDQFDPRSRLFNPADEGELELPRKIYASLPKKLREVTRIGPKYEWLISDEDLKTVLTPD
jgi:hypothetical protein